MKILGSKNVYLSRALIESVVWNIKLYLMNKYGISQAESDLAPLSWYIGTGRASREFLLLLARVKPYMIGRKLHEGGSYNEAIDRVKAYLNTKANEGEEI